MALFAYVGPETLFPVVSFLAGVAGVLLMMGRRVLNPLLRLFRVNGRGSE